jgi:histidinol-phosphate aminotransferase
MFSPKEYIQKLRPAAHGGRHYAELKRLGIDPARVVDFSVSTNPLGPPDGLAGCLVKADLESYPDSDSNLLKNRLAEKLGLAVENLVIGNGSTELIRMCAAAYLGAGDRALIMQPTYGEYELAAQLVGAEIVSLKLAEKEDFRLNLGELEKTIKLTRPRAIFVCNPNNPTGEYLVRDKVQKIMELAPHSLVALDEAYISFLDKAWASAELIKYPNLVIIRSMTKDYAIAGIRLGYAFGEAGLISTLTKVKPPWNVSSLAQAAGLYVLEGENYVAKMRAELAKSGKYLKTNLEKLGLRPLPSEANFFLVRVGDAARLRADLLEKGILVRDCASFGLPQYIRLAHRTRSECTRLCNALSELGVEKYDR